MMFYCLIYVLHVLFIIWLVLLVIVLAGGKVNIYSNILPLHLCYNFVIHF